MYGRASPDLLRPSGREALRARPFSRTASLEAARPVPRDDERAPCERSEATTFAPDVPNRP